MKHQPKRWDVVVLGGINTDFVIRGHALPKPGQTVRGETFYSGPGGKGANQAVAVARLGGRVALIGSVGRDDRGRELLRGLRRNGVDVRHVSIHPRQASGAAVIAVDEAGEKQISAALGANMTVTASQVTAAESLIASARVLLMQLEVPMAAVLRAAVLARKYGTPVVLDPAPAQQIPSRLFPLLEAIRPNRDEAEQITGCTIGNSNQARKAANALIQRGVKIVAIEAGDEGDLVIWPDGEIILPRFKVKAVDATGAGDAFAGAFALALAEGLELRKVAELANATAALATTRIGAQEALPERSQVERLLKRH